MLPVEPALPDKPAGDAPITSGLSSVEALRRLRRDGPNVLRVRAGSRVWRRLAAQFSHVLALLLWMAAALALLADRAQPGQGMRTLAIAIVAVVVVNALFSFLQEYRADRALRVLQRLLPDQALVRRDGEARKVDRETIVVGDVLLLEEGALIPADARLIDATALQVDMSALTGESTPRLRAPVPTGAGHALEDPSLVWAGTTVVAGHGVAIVNATGARTAFGEVAALATATTATPSPLQRELTRVTRVVAILACAFGAAFFALGVLAGLGVWASAVFGIGIIVANVPEGLLPTVTLALAAASQRMARQGALVKRLTAVETLGCATVICTDKTGTLTENRMRVDRLWLAGHDIDAKDDLSAMGLSDDAARWLVQVLRHCHNARARPHATPDSRWIGDPTEVALVEYAARHGVAKGSSSPRLTELPFDSERRRMTTVNWVDGRLVALAKGAPESILACCSRVIDGAGIRHLSAADRTRLARRGRRYAGAAYRVLGIAMRPIESGIAALNIETVERDLTFVGFVALRDPPRPEVPEAIARCRAAGVRVVMITGDHPHTAIAVARSIGLQSAVHGPRAIIGAAVEAMSDAELRTQLSGSPARALVFARMAPRHKLRVVAALKAMGDVVAVTGDGVNDAPALKHADIGIAMGIAGTDVAKEVADIVLLDDNFATIVKAIEAGRGVYANIRKFVTYVLASNVPELVPVLAFGLGSMPLALTIPQILAIDLGTDLMPALALGADPPDPGTMRVPPRPRSERLLDRALLVRAYGVLGVIEAVLAMSAFVVFLVAHGWTWPEVLAPDARLYREATTVALATVVMAQVGNVFACRTDAATDLRRAFAANYLLFAAIAVEILLLLAIVYTRPGQYVFGTVALDPMIWLALLPCPWIVVAAERARVRFQRRPRDRQRARDGAGTAPR